MGAERSLGPAAVQKILDWDKRRKDVESIQQIAAQIGTSPSTVCRIVRDRGYGPGKRERRRAEIEAAMASFEKNVSVPRRTEKNESHQERACTQNQL